MKLAVYAAEIEPDRAPDDFGWELMTGIRDGVHPPTYRGSRFA